MMVRGDRAREPRGECIAVIGRDTRPGREFYSSGDRSNRFTEGYSSCLGDGSSMRSRSTASLR